MSVAARVISGSLASWAKILVTAGTQIGLVPIFLAYWSVEQYGCWLVIQSASAFINIFSLAHHTYVGNEFLRVPNRDPKRISELLSAALPCSAGLGLFELALVGGLAWLGGATAVFNPNGSLPANLVLDSAISLLLLSISTFLSVFASGLYNRAAGAFGHFPRSVWWGVGIAIATASASALFLFLGADLLTLSMGIAAINLLLYGLYQVDLWRLIRLHGVTLCPPSWTLGRKNLVASLHLGLSYLLGLVRQQGTRIMVSTTLGVTQAVAFTTMRTASNLAQQGVSTVVEPVFPELMGFLRDRQQAAIGMTFAFVWLMVIFVMGPMLVALQAVAPDLFTLWTRGKVAFDPLVFAMFSMMMIVFALARPADSIILGNNMGRVQVFTAASLAVLTIGGIVALDDGYGIRGIALVLLVTELIGATITLSVGFRWLADQQLGWPARLFTLASFEVIVCCTAMLTMALQPAWRSYCILITVLTTGALATGFFRQLPQVQVERLRRRLGRYLPFSRRG